MTNCTSSILKLIFFFRSRYNLLQFKDIVGAVKQGNLLRLTSALEANEKFFINWGIFLILEKLKIICYRCHRLVLQRQEPF